MSNLIPGDQVSPAEAGRRLRDQAAEIVKRSKSKSITWVDPDVIPDAAHLLHHSQIWCVANKEGQVAIYDHGTGRNQANSVQGNRHLALAERFVDRWSDQGAVGVRFVDHLFIVDSPGRY